MNKECDREKRTSWEMPGISIQHRSHGNVLQVKQQTQMKQMRRAKANCAPQQPSTASAVHSKPWVSSWKRLLTPWFYSLQTHHSNWGRGAPLVQFSCDFATHRFITDHPVSLQQRGVGVMVPLEITNAHHHQGWWPKLPKNVLQKYPPYINCLLKVLLT